MVEFIAEIKEVKMSKVALDNVYTLRVITDDEKVLSLGAIPSDQTVKVTVEIIGK